MRYQYKVTLIVFLATLSVPSLCIADQNPAILPVPDPPAGDLAKIELGSQLFHDPLFSENNTLSCASCHSLKQHGIDKLPRYITITGEQGSLNTPTVFNASLSFNQFWNGRAHSLEEVIDDHINDMTIFANNWSAILQRIQDSKTYHAAFNTLYADGITIHNVKEVLISFLDILLTPHSPFDNFLEGDTNALSPDAKKGYQLFQQYGCITCHQGINMGGNLVQPLGIYKPYYLDPTKIAHSDLGHFNVTRREDDKFAFKVPSLRNVAVTAPYLHDGSIATLEEIVQIMGIYEVGQAIPDHDITYIVTFLESLTADLPTQVSNIIEKK